MFRRKSRSVAYTGVQQAPMPGLEPDSGATAAARSIGQSLKKSQPHIYGQPTVNEDKPLQNEQPSKNEQPSENGQPSKNVHPTQKRQNLEKRTNSGLLKRSTSFAQAGRSASMSSSTFPKGTPRHESINSVRPVINGAQVSEPTRLSSINGSNEARLRDLRLQHMPEDSLNKPVKMIKKYIPTPNGIQVVEVPESSYKKELARSNSMRSGLSVRNGLLTRTTPRSPSLSTSSGSQRLKLQMHSRKGPGLRLSSFTHEYSIVEEPDDVLEQQLSRAQRLNVNSLLKSEIEREKQRARDLAKERLEYEQLETLRAQNEKMQQELQMLKEKDRLEVQHKEAKVENIDPNLLVRTSTIESDTQNPKPEVQNHFVDFSASNELAEDGDDEEDVPIVPVPHAVDEVELKRTKNGHPPPLNRDSFVESAYTLDDDSSQEHPTLMSELEVMESYNDGTPVLNVLKDYDTKEYGIKEYDTKEYDTKEFDTHDFDTQEFDTQDYNDTQDYSFKDTSPKGYHSPVLESPPAIFIEAENEGTVLPTFDPVPEVIADYNSPLNIASSIRSASSIDSKSKPIKSAMKNPKPRYGSVKTGAPSPAENAYLSLTTAENTRLNSKISTTHLSDGNNDLRASLKTPPPSATKTPQKRMSLTLRNPPTAPSVTPGGMSTRTIRPRRHSDIPQGRFGDTSFDSTSNGGMSSRKLRAEPVKPIAPHPLSDPNYQSPSKQKAAALYEKANMRPSSYFGPSVERKSSFSRQKGNQENELGHTATKAQPMSSRTAALRGSTVEQGKSPSRPTHNEQTSFTTMRSVVAPNNTKHMPVTMSNRQVQSSSTFKSKIVDSDSDNDELPARSSARPTRFAASDDEAPPQTSMPHSLRDSHINSVRKTPPSMLQEPVPKVKEEKKKTKKKFLKKLFGLN